MPRWYRTLSLAIRVLCAIAIAIVFIWHESLGIKDTGIAALIVIFIALAAALMSLPKAVIEQRNRNRGLKDGTFQEYLRRDSEQRRRS